MELAVNHHTIKSRLLNKDEDLTGQPQNLVEAAINVPYVIRDVNTPDLKMKEFLFTLGCYPGETVTVISVLAENYVINVKDARYSIDTELARAILV